MPETNYLTVPVWPGQEPECRSCEYRVMTSICGRGNISCPLGIDRLYPKIQVPIVPGLMAECSACEHREIKANGVLCTVRKTHCPHRYI